MARPMQDIPQLVEKLQEERKHHKDIVVPSKGISMFRDQAEGLCLQLRTKDVETAYTIEKQVHTLLSPRLGIPGKYYRRMQDDAQSLLCQNVNYWLSKEGEDNKNRLVRISRDSIRAVLSDRFRPIDNLDVVTTAVQAVTDTKDPENYAGDARCFNWSLSPTHLDVCFVNPGIVIDLNNLDKGIQVGLKHHKEGKGGGTQFVYAGSIQESGNQSQGGWFRKTDGDDGGHYVFPAARIRNSETGFGSLKAMSGLYEAVCDNTCWIGTNLAKTHLGSQLEEGEEVFSSDTYKKMNSVIFSKVRDIIKAVFSPENLMLNAKRMKGLADVIMPLSDVQDHLVKLPGLTDEIRDEILNSYKPLQADRQTLLDAQRAITKSAQSFSDHPDKSLMLEDLGGRIVEQGIAALTV